jgi:hypothetical protein
MYQKIKSKSSSLEAMSYVPKPCPTSPSRIYIQIYSFHQVRNVQHSRRPRVGVLFMCFSRYYTIHHIVYWRVCPHAKIILAYQVHYRPRHHVFEHELVWPILVHICIRVSTRFKRFTLTTISSVNNICILCNETITKRKQ